MNHIQHCKHSAAGQCGKLLCCPKGIKFVIRWGSTSKFDWEACIFVLAKIHVYTTGRDYRTCYPKRAGALKLMPY